MSIESHFAERDHVHQPRPIHCEPRENDKHRGMDSDSSTGPKMRTPIRVDSNYQALVIEEVWSWPARPTDGAASNGARNRKPSGPPKACSRRGVAKRALPFMPPKRSGCLCVVTSPDRAVIRDILTPRISGPLPPNLYWVLACAEGSPRRQGLRPPAKNSGSF